MAIQTANLGAAPSGVGGDTFRSAATKFNENFTNYAHAASRLVGTQAGNLMQVGAFGVGYFNRNSSVISTPSQIPPGLSLTAMTTDLLDIQSKADWQDAAVLNIRAWDSSRLAGAQAQIAICGPGVFLRAGRSWDSSDVFDGGWIKVYTSRNTTTDSNGFVKAASPIVKLFADKIELNDEAQRQNVEFEKLGVGDYLIKGSSGFAQEGWYVETPKDANGNLLVAVVYEQLENGDISVKTYDYMLNKKGRIVADTETPLDIPENRWIDIRLQELPQPEIEIPESITPPEFQPTGLAQAVATVMESYHDPEQ